MMPTSAGTIITVIKAVWPFVKEVIFQSEELKTALKENVVSIVLVASVAAMFFLLLELYTQANHLNVQLNRKSDMVNALETRNDMSENIFKDKLEFQEKYFTAISDAKDYQIELLNSSLENLKTENLKLKEEIVLLRKNPAPTRRSPQNRSQTTKEYLDRLEKLQKGSQ